MKSWVWITRWFLFCFRYSGLYQMYHKKHETPSIRVSFNKINKRLVFRIKDGYKLELQTP